MCPSQLDERVNELSKKWENSHTIEEKSEKKIHDSIHGTIVLDDFITALVDLPPVQRLREIKQLGPVKTLYPTANHTRFEHTLGVYYVAKRILSQIENRKEVEITDAQKREVKAAAILHDIGHLPFSHMTERFVDEQTDIEKTKCNDSNFDQKEINRAEIDTHEYLAYKFLNHEYFEKKISNINSIYGTRLNLDRICDRILGLKSDLGYTYLTHVIHGPLDADRIDYLQRDTHNIGFPSMVDSDRLIMTLKPVEDPESERTVKLGIDEKGIQAAESLFVARDRLRRTAHNHHVTKVTGAMILRDLNEVFDDPFQLVGMTDYELHSILSDRGPRFERYRYRQLPKRYAYYDVNGKDARVAADGINIKKQIKIENKISQELGTTALVIKSGFGDASKSDIGDTIVKVDDDTEEIGVHLERRFESVSPRADSPQLQVHVDWEYLETEPPVGEFNDVREILAEELEICKEKLEENNFNPTEYTALSHSD